MKRLPQPFDMIHPRRVNWLINHPELQVCFQPAQRFTAFVDDIVIDILFGKLQTTAAEKLHVDPLWLAAANTSGATGGKMISPQSIAIAVSATHIDGQGSVIMSGTLKYCFAYIVILGLKVGLVYHLFMA